MKTILPQSRFFLFVFLIANLLFANVFFGQTVTLDQADLDYAPGETVVITGTGWHSGETVALQVDNLTNPDVDCGPVTPQPHELWTVVADENGNFTASWYVNDCELGADLMLGALGQTSGFTYKVFFTDANVTFATNGLPSGTNVTVNYRVYPSNGSPSGNFTTIYFTTPNSSSPAIAVSNSQMIEYTFNDIVVSGVTYKASGGSVVGANNGNGGQLITGNFTVCTAPVAPSVNASVTYCQGASAVALTATGSNLLWYTTVSGGTGSITAPTPSTTTPGTTSYYVSQTIGCESPRAKIDVVVNSVIPGTIGKGAVQPGPGCGTLDPGITSVITAASGSGTISYIWQKSTDGGVSWSTIPSETASQYNSPSLITTTAIKRIAVSILNGLSCSAESNVLTYEVNPVPIVTAILPGGTTNVCVGSVLQLSNATPGGVWSSANPEIATVTTNGLITGIASGSVAVSYTVTDSSTGCFKVANKTVHVLELPIAPTAVNYSGVYDGVSHVGSATPNLGEVIDWYTTSTGTTTAIAPSGINVGTYSAYAEARNTITGCKSTTRTLVTVTITQKNVTVTANAKSKTYGDANPALDAVVSGTVNGDVLSYTLETSATQFSGVGNYPIEVTLGANPNYSITPTNALLTIGERDITITADAKSKTYGEADPALTYQITSGSLAFSDSFSGSLSRDTGEIVGDYAITQGSVALNSNYALTYVGADLTIDLRSVEITADAKSKTYGEADPVLTYQISSGSLVTGDSFSGSLSRDTGEIVGDYAITQGSVALNSNYTLTYVGADLTIDLRSVEITADAKSKTYGEADPALTYQISSGSLVTGDSFSGSLSRDTGEIVGNYAITQGSVALNSNYTLTYVGADLTIDLRLVEITADAKSKTYGEADPALTYQISSGSLAFSDSFSGSLSRDTGEIVGNYAITQGSVALNSNYTLTYVGANLTIGKRDITITADAKSKTYGEADPALTYQISSGSLVTGDSFSGSLSRDTGEIVGDYAITQGSVALNSNYALSYVGANLTIGKRDITITADAKSKTYGEADPALTYQITSGSLAFSDSFSGSLSRDTGEIVGDYAITQGSVALSSNYALTYVGANLTIGKRDITITADAKFKTYGEADPALTYQISSGSLVTGDSFSGSLSRDTGEIVGNYAITQGSVALNSNYALSYVGANLTIGKRDITITADAKSKTYGEADPVLTYQISSGSLVTGDSFSGSLSRDTGEIVGDYAITQGSVALNSNYTLTYVGADLTIDLRSVEITADAKSKTYGEADPALTYQISSGSLVTGDSFSGSLSRDTGEIVGDYAITQGSVTLNSNYALSYVGANLTIGKRDITITADAKSKTYGEADPALTYQISSGSLVTGDSFSGSLSRDTGEIVGDYAITQGSVTLNSNYALSYVGANLTIGKRDITITADAKSKTYGEADPALTYQISSGSLAFSDSFSGSLSRDTGEIVGDYAITQGSVTLNSNYALSYVGANLTIGKRDITITADAKSKTYGEADPALTYQISSGSLVTGDSFSGSLSRDTGEIVGDYAITQGSVALNSNYTLTYVVANLTIGKRDITITADAKFKCFGVSDPGLTAQLTSGSIISGDTVSGQLERNSGESAGVYAINKGTYTYGNNYNETYISANLTINSQITATFTRTNPNHYFGLSGDQTSKITVIPSGGIGPYTVTITMDRSLISNYINSSGDESWIPDPITMPATTSSYNIVLPSSGSNTQGNPYTITTGVQTAVGYSIKVGLIDDAGFTATITDSKGCTITTEKIFIHGEDVRCFAGKSGVAKVKLCHRTGNTKNPCQELCVDESAVAAHLAHGDFLGTCTPNCEAPTLLTKSSLATKGKVMEVEVEIDPFSVIAYPNPSSSQFSLVVNSESQEKVEVLVYDMLARLIKRIETKDEEIISFGEDLPSGEYLVLVRQGEKRKSVNVIKK
ncbi:MBG domain-containing protein [Flavobacterium sp. GSA192]|uniref:MBG domain-containing protein n=1 Tax=Flavobacterium sp. GSA192 TaxID=2576304 RepID=UPI001125C7A0|nr:MBG domain-containing protein [Flavobacterium sp. GSA192]